MPVPRELKIAVLLVAGLIAARSVVLLLDRVAERLERRALYR
jgi:hypothetical protein